MTFFAFFSYFFRKHSWLRTLLIFGVLVVLFAGSFGIRRLMEKKPEITAIEPPVASPGDVITISGTFFGNSRQNGYVEISGTRLTESSYLDWKDTYIQAVLPPNIQNGLVYVVTNSKRSNALVFANKNTIPVPIPPDPATALPNIVSIREKEAAVGALITITGINFGNTRNASKVFFTWAGDGSGREQETVACSEADFDYERWEDQEISVRVPNGAASGNVFIVTEKGTSNKVPFLVSGRAGTKNFTNKRTYVVNVTVDLTEITAQSDTAVTVRVPRPPITAAQRNTELVTSKPEPLIADFGGTIVHQFDLPKTANKSLSITQSFVITVYAVNSKIQSGQIRAYEKNSLLYTTHTRPDAIIKSDSPEIITLVKTIIGKETNPYLQAKLIYTWLLDHVSVSAQHRPGNADPLESLKTGAGDAYDISILFCSLVRAAGIPSIPASGILADRKMGSHVHWWNEIYIPQLGWIPVDVALGSGLSYENFTPNANPRDFYFGNLDDRHITFSRGWNQLKPTSPRSQIVYRPKTYALQSIWEETTGGMEKYTSLWSNPAITGVY